MTPMMLMPILRQMHKIPEGPWWRRALCWFRSQVVYEVAEEFHITIRLRNGLWTPLTLPAGFRSDLASTPRISWLFGFRPDGPLLLPGLFHDFFYRHGFVCGGEGCRTKHFQRTGKLQADMLFAQLAVQTCGLKAPAIAAFVALFLFGLPAWWSNAKYRAAAWKTGELQLKGDYRD